GGGWGGGWGEGVGGGGGGGKQGVEYRHVIDWLVRKPGAFADYRYRADLFPSSQFRLAYDTLHEQQPARAAKEYLGILHLAARRSEAGVAAALQRLLAEGRPLGVAAVEGELTRSDSPLSPGGGTVGPVGLASYDALLQGKEADDGEGREGHAGGLPEGVAPAGVPAVLRGAGEAGPAGVVELRAIPAAPGGAGVPGAAGQ